MRRSQNAPWSAWLLLSFIVVDRSISAVFGFEPDWVDYLLDLLAMAFGICLVLTGSRVVWSVMALFWLAAMAWITYLLVAAPVPIAEYSHTSYTHMILGDVILALLVANPQLLKWVWKDRAEMQKDV
ncbi:hypothetical protein [uncultured Erythrobacter sp.]|uniref:hypothetical protein n=1 Tax=uncultured Erythrobacter sp. TaxID=263913 RepID=UPI002629FFE7|nr:hypothetical protein [uncultured Erythrobacter sp.]